MMLDLGHPEKGLRPRLVDWWPALLLAGVVMGSLMLLAVRHLPPLPPAAASQGMSVRDFSQALFGRYGVAVEIISMQLLFAVVGALYLGRRRKT
jgi:NADH-quinone oxidoreductase subunit J